MIDGIARTTALRGLADALDKQSAAKTLPGISAPTKIIFANHNSEPLSGYGNNPALLAAVEREIRLSWDELRSRALARLDASVQQLTAQVAVFVVGAAAPGTEDLTDDIRAGTNVGSAPPAA